MLIEYWSFCRFVFLDKLRKTTVCCRIEANHHLNAMSRKINVLPPPYQEEDYYDDSRYPSSHPYASHHGPSHHDESSHHSSHHHSSHHTSSITHAVTSQPNVIVVNHGVSFHTVYCVLTAFAESVGAAAVPKQKYYSCPMNCLFMYCDFFMYSHFIKTFC